MGLLPSLASSPFFAISSFQIDRFSGPLNNQLHQMFPSYFLLPEPAPQPDSDTDNDHYIAKLNQLLGREPTDRSCLPIDDVLEDVKRFVGRTTTSYLFVIQEDGEDERLLKVVPFGRNGNMLDIEDAYKEAMCRR